VRPGRSKVFYLRAQNDGDATDSFKVKGCRSSPGFRVTYLRGARGAQRITSSVVAGRYKLRGIPPAGVKTSRIKIAVGRGEEPGATKRCLISFRSVSKPTLVDAVKTVLRVR
jgi:hypothetical protein